jgi:hypothetical protein
MSMELKYIFTINRNDNRIDFLSYNTGFDISILKEEDDEKPPHYTFSSRHLNTLENSKEIWERALSLITILNGACNLLYYNPIFDLEYIKQDPYDIKLLRLYKYEDFTDITPNDAFELVQGHPFDENINTNPQPNTVGYNELTRVIHLATKEIKVRNILLQLGYGLDYKNLYSIYDSVRTYSENNLTKILNKTSFTDDDLNAFTGTANNFGILGIEARHGDKSWGTPKKTMGLREAQKLIIELCNSYIKFKYP